MAITLRETYGDRATEPSEEYPGGTFKNENPPGSRNGTPLENKWARDKDGFFQAALSEADMPPLEIGDTATNSQYLKALKVVVPNHSCPPQASLSDVCRGLIDVQAHDPSKSPNFLDIGMDIFDSCVGIRPSCWENFFTPMIYCVTGVSGDLYAIKGPWIHDGDPRAYHPSITWPYMPTGFYSVCYDGGNLYVLWTSSLSNFQVSKISLTAWTGVPEWTRDTGLNDGSDNRQKVKMIVANDDNLAILANISDPSEDPEHGVVIVAKDDGVMVTGTGNNTLGDDGELPVSKLLTDGTRVYWMLRRNNGDNTYSYFTASATISSPSSSSISLKSIGTFSTTEPDTWPRGFTRVGNSILTLSQKGTIYQTKTDSSIMGTAMFISNFTESTIITEDDYDVHLGFDGTNVWACLWGSALASSVLMSLYKIPASTLEPYGPNAASIQCSQVGVAPLAVTVSLRGASILSDRQDLWLVLRDGKFYRVCLPGLR